MYVSEHRCELTWDYLFFFGCTKFLETLTLENIDQMLTEVLDWHTLGIKLGIPGYLLGKIQIDFSSHGTTRQRQEMIKTWLTCDKERSWRKLACILEEMEMHVVAKEIRDKYTPDYDSKFAGDICKCV